MIMVKHQLFIEHNIFSMNLYSSLWPEVGVAPEVCRLDLDVCLWLTSRSVAVV